MEIYLNSKKILIEQSVSLEELLEGNGFTGKSFAAALNRQFVPRGQYAKTVVKENDCVDVVFPMQGG